MRATQLSQVSICREQQHHNHESQENHHNQSHGQDNCRCCCCINYNFFTLGYRLARSSDSFTMPFSPELFSTYLQLNNHHLKKEDESQKEIQIVPEVASALVSKAKQNKESLNQQEQPSLHQKDVPTGLQQPQTLQTNGKKKLEQPFNWANQSKPTYGQFKDSQGNMIYKINNLGDESQNNSSTLREQIQQQQSKNELPEAVREGIDKFQGLKEEQVVHLKQEQNRQQIYLNSSEIQRAFGESSNIIDQFDYPGLNQSHHQDQFAQSEQQDRVRKRQNIQECVDKNKEQQEDSSQNYSAYSDNAIPTKNQNYIRKEQQQQSSFQAQKVQENDKQQQQARSQLVYQIQNNNFRYQNEQDNRILEFQQPKNQHKSSQLNNKQKIKEELPENVAANVQQDEPNQEEEDKEHSVSIIKETVLEDPFHPFSQPEHQLADYQLVSSRQIYSLHQQFQYNHQEIEAEKSRKSRYSKKLDQQLQSEQRKQYTEIQSLNQKLEKLEYNSQSNPINNRQSLQSQNQSLPLPEIKNENLKQQQSNYGQDENQAERQRLRLRSLSQQSAQAIQQALDQNFKLSQSYEELPKKEKEQDQIISGGLFSDDQQVEESSHQQNQLKKQEQQEDQAYAVISIEEQIKRENIPLVQIQKWEQPPQWSVPNNNDFTSCLANPSQKMDELLQVKEEDKLDLNLSENVSNQQSIESNKNIVKKDDNEEGSERQQASYLPAAQPSECLNNDYLSDKIDQLNRQVELDNNSKSQQVQVYKEEEQSIQKMSQEQSQSQQQQQQISTEKRIKGPRISKQSALELKKRSKYQRKSAEVSNNQESKIQNLSITKTIELNINKCEVVENKKSDEQVIQPPKPSMIKIASQFSFYECGSSIASERPKKPAKTEYIRKQDYDPDKYEEIQEVIYKVARKSKPKYKRRIIQQIYQPAPLRKRGNTKKLARQYARKKYQSRREKSIPTQSEEEIEQIYYQEQSASENNESEIVEYQKPPSYRSKKRKEKVQYVYVNEPIKKKKYSRVVEQSSSSQDQEKRTKKKHSFRKL